MGLMWWWVGDRLMGIGGSWLVGILGVRGGCCNVWCIGGEGCFMGWGYWIRVGFRWVGVGWGLLGMMKGWICGVVGVWVGWGFWMCKSRKGIYFWFVG